METRTHNQLVLLRLALCVYYSPVAKWQSRVTFKIFTTAILHFASYQLKTMTSDRPISVQELLKQKRQNDSLLKPVFLSKKKRELLKLQQQREVPKAPVVKKRLIQNYEEGEDNDYEFQQEQQEQHNARKRSKKFNFDWDPEADTTDRSQEQLSLLLPQRSSPDKNSISSQYQHKQSVHWSAKPLNKMTDRDWRIMKEDYDITNRGGSILNPLRSWQESEIPTSILQQLQILQYHEPTLIQRATIPTALHGRDIIGIAETGSGKTLAFIIPILTYILTKPRMSRINKDQGPYCLILVPTRELALQIEKEFNKFQMYQQQQQFKCCSIIGGHSFEELIYKIKDGVDIVIGTPGRLNDCIERKIIVFNQCNYLVMDEADRMINMGFEIQVNKILEMLPREDRRTMMFTATMPPEIEKMTAQYLHKPGIVMIGEVGNAVDTVVQEVEFINDDKQKMTRLIQILTRQQFKPPIIIFVNYKKTGDDINMKLTKEGFKCILMHGSKTQEQRELAIHSIKRGSAEILIATDIAGRGIDINDVSIVINYQMSRNIEDYTHRIGRTGRAGKIGHAITFITEQDSAILSDLRKIISSSSVSKVSEELKKREFNQKNVVRNIVN